MALNILVSWIGDQSAHIIIMKALHASLVPRTADRDVRSLPHVATTSRPPPATSHRHNLNTTTGVTDADGSNNASRQGMFRNCGGSRPSIMALACLYPWNFMLSRTLSQNHPSLHRRFNSIVYFPSPRCLCVLLPTPSLSLFSPVVQQQPNCDVVLGYSLLVVGATGRLPFYITSESLN